MRSLFKKLWADDTGAILATEYTLLSGIVVFGVAGSMAAVRNQINQNLATIGGTLQAAMPDQQKMQAMISPPATTTNRGEMRVLILSPQGRTETDPVEFYFHKPLIAPAP